MKKRQGTKKKKSPAKRFLTLLGAAVVIILFVACLIFFREYGRKTKDGKPVTLEVAEGTSTRELVDLLKEKGLIRYKLPFYLKLYQTGQKGKLRYGSYELNDGMILDDLIRALSEGTEGERLVLTVPEGYSVEQIGARLEKEGIMTADEFCGAVRNAAAGFSRGGALPEEDSVYFRLQGYLFPDTYYLDEDMSAEDLVAMMLEEFGKKFDEDCRKRAEELGMSVNEVLIRASLVEKETDLPEEFPTIAGVINNRLEQKMKLQFDSTVVYGMTEGQYGVDRVLYSHLDDDSAYNTYKIKGLPPGPICNPGMEAIKAVLYPEEHKYLYFMMDTRKNDGSNLFFETYEEHKEAYSTMTHGEETDTAEEKDTRDKKSDDKEKKDQE